MELRAGTVVSFRSTDVKVVGSIRSAKNYFSTTESFVGRKAVSRKSTLPNGMLIKCWLINAVYKS